MLKSYASCFLLSSALLQSESWFRWGDLVAVLITRHTSAELAIGLWPVLRFRLSSAVLQKDFPSGKIGS